MRRLRRRSSKGLVMVRFTRSAVILFVVLAASMLAAQQTPPAATSPAGSGGLNRGSTTPTGPVPRLPNGQIDLSGVWQGGGPVGNIADGLAKGEALPIRPAPHTTIHRPHAHPAPAPTPLPPRPPP